MSLKPGATLAHYRITAALGAGGMGEVWRATDTRLGREVALKVLPESFADDPERHARFEREAKTLASLNHPNIATLYGLEHLEVSDPAAGAVGAELVSARSSARSSAPADGVPGTAPAAPVGLHVLVMELVEGEGLDELVARGPVPVDDAIRIALQIAEGLEAAHEAGIVHRDLKPANVRIRPDGAVKVLDFGLAKAWETEKGDSSLSLSPTMTKHATAAGVILGTAAYMSPEQARGKPVDRRADIWAFGVVLWEMLTGRVLFAGDTVSDVLASVLKDSPDLRALPSAMPHQLRRLIARCLTREPRDRLQWIGDARLDLAEAGAEPVPTRPTRTGAAAPGRGGRGWLPWVVAVGAVAAAAAVWWRPAAAPDPPLARFTVALDADQRLSFIDQPIIALSPDGRILAMTATDPRSGRDMVFLRRLDGNEVVPLPGTEGAGEMFFSPDGASVAFFAEGKLKRVSVEGGSVVTVAAAPNPRGGVWLRDGTIVFSPEYATGLWRVSDSGGTAELVVDVDAAQGERTFRFPHATPDGGVVLFTVGATDSPNNYDEAVIAVYSLATGERRTVIERASMARFVRRDQILFARAGSLFAIAFDPRRLETVGEAVPVIEDVGGDPSSGAGYFTVAHDGNLAWLAGSVTAADTLLTLVNGSGTSERLPLTPRGFHQPRFSPDGSRLAFTVGEGYSGVAGDVWVFTLATRALSRLTFGGNDLYPVWYPDGRRIAYLAYDSEAVILVKAADGSAAATRLTATGATPIFPESISPDGRTLAYTRVAQTADIFLATEGEDARLFETQASCPAFSPRGRWIAYASPGSGSSSVFVRPVEGEGKWQVSPVLGGYPRWSGDGRRLYYIDIGSPKRPLMVVDVEPGDTFSAGPPRVVLDSLSGSYVTSTAPATNWDVSPSGDRFAFVEFERRAQAAVQVEMALNWARHLELESR